MIKSLLSCTPLEILKTLYSFMCTKLFFRPASLIRRPVVIRGKKRNIHFSAGLFTGILCRFEVFEDGFITFGKNCHIGDYVHIAASEKVSIGDDVLIASKVYISDTSHGNYTGQGSSPLMPPNQRPLVASPLAIENNVWIGEGVSVLPGTKIGEGSIIGANAVVSKDIPPLSVAAGIPAKVIKRFNPEKNIWEKV